MSGFSAFLKTNPPLALLTAFVFIFTALFGPFAGGIWAGAGLGLGGFFWLWTVRTTKALPRPDRSYTGFLAVFFILCVLAGAFSPFPDQASHTTLKLLSIFLPLLGLSLAKAQDKAYPAFLMNSSLFALLLGLGVLIPACDSFANGFLLHSLRGPQHELTDYNRGLSYSLMMAWPVAALLVYRKAYLPLLFMIAAFIPALWVTQSGASWAALGAGLIAALIAVAAPRFLKFLLKISIVFCAFWPVLFHQIFVRDTTHWLAAHLPGSWLARVEIWDAHYFHIMERPFLGWGLGATRHLPPTHPELYQIMTSPASHPHNIFTQFWMDLGLGGLLLLVVAGLYLVDKIAATKKQILPFAFGAYTGCFALALCAYNFWTDSLLSLFALLTLAFLFVARTTECPAPKSSAL